MRRRPCGGVKDGWSLYYDGHHLSEYGNKQLVEMYRFAVAPPAAILQTK